MYENLSSNPQLEARQILGLVERGIESVESARRLIDVSAEDEMYLQKFFGVWTALTAVRYRRAVLRHFEAMLRAVPRTRVRGRRIRIENVSRSVEASR